jgi:hypothetical protein
VSRFLDWFFFVCLFLYLLLDVIFLSSFLFKFQLSLFFLLDVILIIFRALFIAFSNSPPSSLALPSLYHLPFHCILAHLPEDKCASSCHLIQFARLSFDRRYLIHFAPRRSFLWVLLPPPPTAVQSHIIQRLYC